MRLITSDEWNMLKAPGEAVSKADSNCICARFGKLNCYCNRTNNANVIVIYSDEYSIKNIKSLYEFLIYIYEQGVNYITVSCRPNRYRIMQKIFSEYYADGGIQNKSQYLYFHLCADSVKLLKELSK